MKEDPDEADVARVLAGDLAGFEGIVARSEGRLFALAFRLCRDHGRAEDMTQEAFVKIFRSLHQWRGDSTFSTWMTSVALHAFRSHLRVRTWIGERLKDEARVRDRSSEESSEDERAEAVRRAVAVLPARYRDALSLFYFKGQDIESAARILNVPTGTLKARLHRGRQWIQRALRHR